MKEELFKIIGIFIICLFLFYLAMKALKLQVSVMEGFLSSEPGSSRPSALASVTNGPVISDNSAKGASQFATQIKSIVEKLKTSISVKQYKKDYEAVIMNLDDYISYSMLDLACTINPNTPLGDESNVNIIHKLNTLKQGKDSLNDIMKFVDSK